MSQSSAPSPGAAPVRSPKQDALNNYCQRQGIRGPTFQIVSDRRGGRTAWSCTVSVAGRNLPARYWYDGQFVHSAKEDAAERALQELGQLPAPPGPQPQHYHQQQRTVQGTDPGTIGS